MCDYLGGGGGGQRFWEVGGEGEVQEKKEEAAERGLAREEDLGATPSHRARRARQRSCLTQPEWTCSVHAHSSGRACVGRHGVLLRGKFQLSLCPRVVGDCA